MEERNRREWQRSSRRNVVVANRNGFDDIGRGPQFGRSNSRTDGAPTDSANETNSMAVVGISLASNMHADSESSRMQSLAVIGHRRRRNQRALRSNSELIAHNGRVPDLTLEQRPPTRRCLFPEFESNDDEEEGQNHMENDSDNHNHHKNNNDKQSRRHSMDFFEKMQQEFVERWKERWNFDIVQGKPIPGRRLQWEPVSPSPPPPTSTNSSSPSTPPSPSSRSCSPHVSDTAYDEPSCRGTIPSPRVVHSR